MSDVDSFCCFNLWFSILEFERDHVLLWPESTSSTSLNLQAILSGSPVFGAFCRAAGPGARGFPEAPEPMAEATLTWIHGWAGMKGQRENMLEPFGTYILYGTILKFLGRHVGGTCWACIIALGIDVNCMLQGHWFKLHTSAGARPQKPLWASEWTPWRSLRLSWSHHLLNLLTLLTILPSGFFSPCGQKWSKKHAKTQTTLQIKSQRANTWYRSRAAFFASWQLSCRLVDPGIPPKDGMLPRCQLIHPWRPDSIGKPWKILKPLRKNKFIWKSISTQRTMNASMYKLLTNCAVELLYKYQALTFI